MGDVVQTASDVLRGLDSSLDITEGAAAHVGKFMTPAPKVGHVRSDNSA
jgi:hypothetical protein